MPEPPSPANPHEAPPVAVPLPAMPVMAYADAGTIDPRRLWWVALWRRVLGGILALHLAGFFAMLLSNKIDPMGEEWARLIAVAVVFAFLLGYLGILIFLPLLLVAQNRPRMGVLLGILCLLPLANILVVLCQIEIAGDYLHLHRTGVRPNAQYPPPR